MPENTPNIEPPMGIMMPPHGYRDGAYKVIAPMVAISGSRLLPLIHQGLDARNHLPEPFDLPDHVGNMAVTFVLASRMMNGFWGQEIELVSPREQEARRKRIAVAVGLTSVAANVVDEVIGYGSASTPDVIDFAYGLVGGWLAYKFKAPDYVTPEEIEAITSNKEPSSLKTAVEGLLAALRSRKEAAEPVPTVKQSAKVQPAPPTASAPRTNASKNKSPGKQKAQKAARRKNRRK
jgi:hypothetical protein